MNRRTEAGPNGADTTPLARIQQHQAAGRFAEADKLLGEMLRESPADQTLLHYKAINLIQTGKLEQGRDMMAELMKQTPDNPVQLMDFGVVLIQSGETEKALEYFQHAVDIAPNFGTARSNLGAAQLTLKQYNKAIPHLIEAIRLEPHLMDAHTNLATAYMQTSQFDKAVDILFKVLAIDPNSVQAHTQLSGALFRRERHDAAEHHARRALELAPNAPEPHLHLGNALAAAGRMTEAAQSFLRIAGNGPYGLQALSRLIHLRRTKTDSPELALLEKQLQRAEAFPDEGKAAVNFAAGKAYDDLGDYHRAFEHFKRANDITKALHPFDLQTLVNRSERLLDFCSPAFLRRCSGGARTEVSPVFICGMPRSGTTLVEQMFSRHPDVQAGGELPAAPMALQKNDRLRQALGGDLDKAEIGVDDFDRLGEDYIAILHGEGLRSEFITDKMPSNYRNIGLLALALPQSKFLIMRRHPMDCLLSNYVQHFGQNQPFSTDFINLAGVYKEFDMMAGAWVERLPDRVREVSYEAVTQDTEAQMRSVLDFVGLDWNPVVLDHQASSRQVNTASVAQVREPVYTSSVARWQRYGALLAPLAAELQAFLTKDELAVCDLG